MLKKKNIAMVMAAATIATSVAPVFALEEVNTEREALLKEVESKLAVKYSNPKEDGLNDNTDVTSENEYKNSVYLITAQVEGVDLGNNSGEAVDVKSKAHLVNLLEKADVAGKALKVVITDKGHKEVNGEIVASTKGVAYDADSLLVQFGTATANKTEIKCGDSDQKVADVKVTFDNNNDVTKVELTFVDGKSKVELDTTKDKLDFTKPIDKDGAVVTVTDETSAKTVVGFKPATGKYTQADLNTEFRRVTDLSSTKEFENSKNIKIADVAKDNSSSSYKITLVGDKSTNKEVITVKANDAKLDLNTGIDKNGNDVKIDEVSDTATAETIVGFKLADGETTVDLPSKVVARLVAGAHVMTKEEFNLSTFKNENGYTQAGKDFVELLNLAQDRTITATKNGKVYQIKFDKDSASNLAVSSKDGGYQLNIDLRVAEQGKDLPEKGKENVQLVIKSNVQAELASLKNVLVNKTNVSAATYETLAGKNRFETAVEISKDGFVAKGVTPVTGQKTAGSVVLVGENAVVDGLAAAPLAKDKEAPILFTKKDSVPTETMNEIKRVLNKGGKVYVIGGENTISKAVEAQLANEMNAQIERLEGKDRYATSLEIAGKLTGIDKATKAFVVGGHGLADAMSIAPVASNKVAPIIVTPAEGLTKDAKTFIDSRDSIVGVDVVGGQTRVSTQVLKDLNAMKKGATETVQMTKVERISGANKNETNAEVIKEYFNTDKLQNVYVSKDSDGMLVDALAVAPLAGRDANSAIVLATNDLTASQEKAIKDNKKDNATYRRVQVGNGIAETVMQKVLKALGL